MCVERSFSALGDASMACAALAAASATPVSRDEFIKPHESVCGTVELGSGNIISDTTVRNWLIVSARRLLAADRIIVTEDRQRLPVELGTLTQPSKVLQQVLVTTKASTAKQRADDGHG